MERIGVFVCHCGTNIAGTVDVAKVAEELGKVNGVVFSTHYTYMCSSAGQQMIEDKIHELNLTGVPRRGYLHCQLSIVNCQFSPA